MVNSKLTWYGDSYVDLPILDELQADRVLSVDIESQPGFVVFREACDGYFSLALTKEQLAELIEELKTIHASLV